MSAIKGRLEWDDQGKVIFVPDENGTWLLWN